jgi:signal peptidase II
MVKIKGKRYLFLFVSIALVTVLVDQLTKYFVAVKRPEWDVGFLFIHFVHNTGAGFGILKDQMGILAVISALVAMAVIFYYRKIPQEKIPPALFALFLGGVVGNLIDRVLRDYVVDFFDVGFWPVFNIADMAISASVVGLAWYYWREK